MALEQSFCLVVRSLTINFRIYAVIFIVLTKYYM